MLSRNRLYDRIRKISELGYCRAGVVAVVVVVVVVGAGTDLISFHRSRIFRPTEVATSCSFTVLKPFRHLTRLLLSLAARRQLRRALHLLSLQTSRSSSQLSPGPRRASKPRFAIGD